MNVKETLLLLAGTDVSRCMKCGKCSGRCPAYADMDVKPHQFVSLLNKGQTDRLLSCSAIWHCMSCMACEERCPRGVSPVRVIEAVRDLAARKQGGNGLTAEEIPPVIDERLPQQLLVSAYRKYNK